MITFALMAGAGGIAHEPAAYPIDPVPLRALIREADLIAIAVPGQTEDAAGGADEWLDSRTVVKLEKILKGDIEDAALAVFTNRSCICPQDARFEAGRRCLVFLELEQGAWQTCSLSYGGKNLSDDGLRAYEACIRDYLALGQLPSGEKRDAAELEWIVRVAQDPLTRWEGAYELAAQDSGLAARLSPEQRAALLEALIAIPLRDEGSQELFTLFESETDPRLVRWLLDCLEHEAVKLSWNYDRAVLWVGDRLCDPNLSAWVNATWNCSGSGAQKRLSFRSKTKPYAKVRVEEAEAVLEFVERGRKLLGEQAAR